MSAEAQPRCERTDLVCLLALRALAPDEAAGMKAHLAQCPVCRRELEMLEPVVASLIRWPTDVLRPSRPLWDKLADRVAVDMGAKPAAPASAQWSEPEWEQVAPGISCKLLATDPARSRVSMLVRLGPGVEYPPHSHAGLEELHLLEGELWIDERKLHPGDYSRAEPGTSDKHVWSETGCTCVLVTSPSDILG